VSNNNNLYNILSNFAKLTPKAETPKETAQKIYESVESQGSIRSGLESVLAEKYMGFKKLEKSFGPDIENPGALAASIGRKKYGKAKFQKAAAAGKKMHEGEMMEKAPPGMEDMVLKLKKQYPGEPAKAFATAWSIYNKKHGKNESVANVASDLSYELDEGTCNECGMLESKCGCDHSVNEDYKHKGKAYGGAAQKDDEEDDEDDDDTPKKHGAPKKKDSERSSAKLPKFGDKQYKLPAHKGSTHRHSMSDEPPKGSPERAEWEEKQARKDKAAARKKKKTSEGYSRLESRFRELLGEGRMVDESGSTFDHILNRFKAEVKAFEQGGDLDYDLYEALFDYYCDHGEMPYGTAKARTGDPYEWVTLRLDRALKEGTMAEASPKLPGTVPTGLGGLGKVPQTIKPQQTGPLAAVKDTVKGMLGHKDVDHWEMPKPQDESVEPTIETELNELARLAGLKIADEGNAFTGKLAKTKKGDSFELDGKTFKDTSNLDEGTCPTCSCKPCECNEGNAFGKAVRDAKADGIQPGEKITVGGKEYPVKESLADIAALAGIATEGRDYGDTKFEEPAEFDNTPKEEIMDADVMLKGGDGEVAGQEKKMNAHGGAARFSDNAMESINPIESLGRRLMQAYNSIKIQK